MNNICSFGPSIIKKFVAELEKKKKVKEDMIEMY